MKEFEAWAVVDKNREVMLGYANNADVVFGGIFFDENFAEEFKDFREQIGEKADVVPCKVVIE